MATTSPDNIWTPDAGDDYALTTDLAATADTVQDAITSLRAAAGSTRGTNTERDASSPTTGALWNSTTDGFVYRYNGTSWLYAPGQILGSMVGPATNQSGLNTLVGTVVSTPVLAIGQRVKIVASFSQYLTTGTGSAVAETKWRNNATNVTATTFDGSAISRAAIAASGVAGSGRGANLLVVAAAAAKISAGIFIGGSATSGVVGADGTYLWIESA